MLQHRQVVAGLSILSAFFVGAGAETALTFWKPLTTTRITLETCPAHLELYCQEHSGCLVAGPAYTSHGGGYFIAVDNTKLPGESAGGGKAKTWNAVQRGGGWT